MTRVRHSSCLHKSWADSKGRKKPLVPWQGHIDCAAYGLVAGQGCSMTSGSGQWGLSYDAQTTSQCVYQSLLFFVDLDKIKHWCVREYVSVPFTAVSAVPQGDAWSQWLCDDSSSAHALVFFFLSFFFFFLKFFLW